MTTDLRSQLQKTLGSAYTIEQELGGGGMSRVFVAHETAFNRKAVVKVLDPELVGGLLRRTVRPRSATCRSAAASEHRSRTRGGHERGSPLFHNAVRRRSVASREDAR
ncbi:MAG: hypothetical protein ACT4P6_02150 [Gemmatimonadaceae bacterium]